MSRILITGSSGYIGAKLKLLLEKQGHKVESYDLPKNILNKEEFKQSVLSQQTDIVYHLAALAELSYTDEHPDETFDVNIIGTNNVASVCAELGILLNFVSTCCIYGDPLEVPSKEDRLINPTDTYAMSKAAGEYIVKMWGLAKGLEYNILRFGTVYGPSLKREMRGDMCVQRFMEAAVNKTPIVVTSDGKQNRNFVHIDDLIRGIALVTEKGIKGQTINLCGKEKISINDISEYALKWGATNREYIAKRKDDFRHQKVSIKKAKKLLGWEPEIKFNQGIKDFYDYVVNNNSQL
jgi:UDP-glucose 4-epimerase